MINRLENEIKLSVRLLPWLAAALLVLVQAGGGCSRPPGVAPPPPVVIVALDGLSWQVVGPLMDKGELPQLSRLVAEGAAGKLATARPTWTPVLFTTMATGRTPDVHGINTFVSDEGIPLTSNLRRVPALWNILSQQGLPSLFYGWPVTWPAEEVRGEMISDRWHKTTERQVHPRSSAGLLSTPLQLFRDTWPTTPAELSRLEQVATPDRVSPWLHGSFEGEKTTGEEGPDKLVQLTRRKVETGFLWNAALDSEVKLPLFVQRLRAVRPRLSAVYFNATDMAQHFFGGADNAADGRPEPNPAGRVAIEETYRVYDRLLGRLVEGVRSVEGYENSTFVILSDHGIDLASGDVVRLRPRHGVVQSHWVSSVRQELTAAGLPVPDMPVVSGPAPPSGPESWLTLTFTRDVSMALRSRALNRLDQVGCLFHPDDVYIYFVHNEAPPGVVVISGGDVAGGRTIAGMSVEDMAPTVLALLGLPAAVDMAGRPVALQLAPGPDQLPRQLTAEMITSYGVRQTAPKGEAISSPEDQDIREELQALGYIE
jgi:hypothetical protein